VHDSRRTALDASIRRELQRGESARVHLRTKLKKLLDVLVEHEMTRTEPVTEATLQAKTPMHGLFRTARFQRRLDDLIRLKLARRDKLSVRPTVAGIAAAERVAALSESHTAPQELLRALRRGEIGTV